MTAYAAAETACPECEGRGWYAEPHPVTGEADVQRQCDVCFGKAVTKVATTHPCDRCDGSGEIGLSWDGHELTHLTDDCLAVGCISGQVPYEWATIRPGDVVRCGDLDEYPDLTHAIVELVERPDPKGFPFTVGVSGRGTVADMMPRRLTFLIDESSLTDERRTMIEEARHE